jgi:hypothetical protein
MALGRLLAYCAHPTLAWHRLPLRGRALVVATYFGAAYALTLAVLLID